MSHPDPLMQSLLDEDPEATRIHAELEARDGVIRAVVAERERRGWSQRDLAERLGKQQPAIARFERGDTDPRLDTLFAICKALDLSLSIGRGESSERLVG